jgi:cation diffusion facilitator family transporter
MASEPLSAVRHQHVFLGADHARSERKTWTVIWLCGAMMGIEIVGGLLLGSIALVADGMHMSTHAGALLLAALAYTYARRHAADSDFTFGTGKFGDLAGFASAIVLAMIAMFIGYESVLRIFSPVQIHFAEAIPIACLGLAVNLASAWLLSSGQHHHHHHGHHHDEGHEHDEAHSIATSQGNLILEVFEENVPPRFRLRAALGGPLAAAATHIATVRSDGSRQQFALLARDGFLESQEPIPEPHAFTVHLTIGSETYSTVFEEHGHSHGGTHRDNNMRAAILHVVADAAVSVLVIIGLLLARQFGWLWMDPLAGLVGAGVIASWSYGLIRDTGAILLDRIPDRQLARQVRKTIESDGSELADLHLWRLGPGHLGAIVSVCPTGSATGHPRDAEYYRSRLARYPALSHVTIEVQNLRGVVVAQAAEAAL